jgi:hypothetical protein
MIILYNSYITKVMGNGRRRSGPNHRPNGLNGLPAGSRPLIVVVPGFPWWEHFLEPCGGDTDFNMLVAWTFLAD